MMDGSIYHLTEHSLLFHFILEFNVKYKYCSLKLIVLILLILTLMYLIYFDIFTENKYKSLERQKCTLYLSFLNLIY